MRLIDADAFENYVFDECTKNEISNSEWIAFREWLKDQETIIEFDDEIKKVVVRGVEYVSPQWIPVTERLPEKYGVYLCTIEGEDETDVDTLLFDDGAFGHIDWEVGEFVEWGHEVTAWMPLPAPYEENEND